MITHLVLMSFHSIISHYTHRKP